MELLKYIETLSQEEKELHKDLIKECVEREKEVKQYCKSTQENLLKLYDVVYIMATNAKRAESATRDMIKHTDDLYINTVHVDKDILQ